MMKAKLYLPLFLLCAVLVVISLLPSSPSHTRNIPVRAFAAASENSLSQSGNGGYSTLGQGSDSGAWGNKLSASLYLAFHLWEQQVQIQGQQPSPGISAELEALQKLATHLSQEIDLHMEVPNTGVNALVHTTDDARELESMGISVQSRVGDVATAYIPFARLPEVAALPSVVSIETGQILHILHDVSVPETGAPQVWSSGVTGRGVIVGVIDSGIDPFHSDFINPDGTTRIKYLLDFSDPGDPDSDGNLNGPVFGGTMYTEAEINAALANPGWFYQSADTPRSIPDNSSAGITSQIVVDRSVNISSLAIDVHVTHSFVGDLRVVLTCPSGTTVTLHNRTGGNRDDIIGTFPVTACNGQSAQGTWRLTVSDHAAGDTGRLSFWDLHLNRPVRMTDLVGHGTHVAGTAAGNGRGTGGGLPAGTFKGMAPEANLIVVRGARDYIGGFSTTDIVNALTFIDQKAQELGLPYVANLSLGGHIGPHDGTSLHERAIDNLVGSGKPGKAIVVAAGNEGDEPIHSGGTLSQGENIALQVNVPGGGFFIADIWYKGSDTFGVGFLDPSGAGVNPAPIPPGDSPKCYQSSTAHVCITHKSNDPYNGDKEIQFWVFSRESGTWRLILRGNSVVNGRYDGWIQGCCGWVNPDNQMRVGMPGTARNAITVGAYTTKNRWTDVTGSPRSISATVGDIAAFSSDGPTRDGRLKPEIAAPGQMICSTLSGQSPAGSYGSMYPNNGYICQDGRHGIGPGTSFAAPHVSGAVALLLSANRNLDAIQLRNTLTSAARRDSFVSAAPNNRWGYGKLDLRAVAGKYVYLPLVMRNYEPPTPDTPVPTPIPGGPTLTPTPMATPTPTPTPTPVSVVPVDGNWIGTTNLGRIVGFNVTNNGTRWSTFAVQCPNGIFYATMSSGSISNGAMQYSYDGVVGFTGQFNTQTTASGTYQASACGSGTWTASWVPPTPTPTPRPTSTPTYTPMPTHTPTSTPTPGGPTPTPTFTPPGWQTLVSTTFENDFPGPWRVYDDDGSSNGEYFWARRGCRSFEGSFSGWAVGGGGNGSTLACGAEYPNNASSSMEYGPFSLVGATGAELRFRLWMNTEQDYDRICAMASVDGIDWYGSCSSGNSGGWVDRHFDLSNVYRIGNLLGRPQVWIMLWFVSDGSITYPEGVYVDNLILRVCPAGASCPATSSVPAEVDDTLTEFPFAMTRSR